MASPGRLLSVVAGQSGREALVYEVGRVLEDRIKALGHEVLPIPGIEPLPRAEAVVAKRLEELVLVAHTTSLCAFAAPRQVGCISASAGYRPAVEPVATAPGTVVQW